MKLTLKRTEIQKDIFIYLVCIFFYNLHGLELNNTIANIYDIMKIILFSILIFICIIKHTKIFNIPFVSLFIILLWNFIMTIYMSDDYKTAIVRYLPVIAFLLLIEIYKDRIDRVISIMFNVLFVIITANLVTMLARPNGYYRVNGAKYWLIGQKQEFSYAYIICFVLVLYYLMQRKKIIRSIMMIGIMSYTMFSTNTMTLIICIIGIYITFFYFIRYRIKIKPMHFLYINIILFFGVMVLMLVFSKMTFLQTVLRGMRYTTITKDQNILSRTYIWKEGINIFFKYPFSGVGIISEQLYYKISYGLIAFHPHFHNIIIDQAVSGGIIGIVCFSMFIWSIFYKNKDLKDIKACLFYVAAFWLNIYMLVDCLYSPYVFVIYYLAYYSDFLLEGRNN